MSRPLPSPSLEPPIVAPRKPGPRLSLAAGVGGAGVLGGFGLLGASWWVGARLVAPAPCEIGPCPEDFPAECVEFANERGERVRGWWRAGEPGAGAAVLLHPLRCDRRAMLSRARLLAEAGIGSLLVDLRAHGESVGRQITFGLEESADARAASAFARGRAPGERIGAVGFSLGGAAALLGPRPLEVDALVLEAVYPSLGEAIESRMALRIGAAAAAALAPIFLAQACLRFGVRPSQLRPIDAVRRLRAPVLIAAGTADLKVPIRQSRRIFAAAPEPKELWEVEGVDHDDFLAHDPAGYRERVLAFLRRHLSSAPAPL